MQQAFEFYRQRRFEDALACLAAGKAGKLRGSQRIKFHSLKGTVLHEMGKYDEAVQSYRMAVKLDPDTSVSHYNLGVALKAAGQQELAISAYRKAITREPTEPKYHSNLAKVYLDDSRPAEAAACYRRVIELQPSNTEAYKNLVHCVTYDDEAHPDIAVIHAIVERGKLSDLQICHCRFALGKIYLDVHDYDAAFEQCRMGNEYLRSERPYDPGLRERNIKATMGVFSAGFEQRMQGSGADSRLPVAIVGMPRSGKTMLERLLTKHSAIVGVDELNLISRWAAKMPRQLQTNEPYPVYLRSLDPRILSGLADKYLERLSRDAPQGTLRVTDTMPTGDWLIGFLYLLFPRIKIIHCLRNPMDIGAFIYCKYFAKGNQFASSLENIAHYYSQHLQMMDHWEHVLPVDILTVNYEDLVTNPALELDRIVQYLELDGEQAALEQAVGSIVGDEPGYWQHLEPQLEPLREAYQRYGITVR